MLRWWTIGRATGIGAVAGLAALVLWPFYATLEAPVRIPYVAMLAVAAGCGVSILWISAVDLLLHRPRGQRLVPIRAFDLAFGLLLAAPSLQALRSLLA